MSLFKRLFFLVTFTIFLWLLHVVVFGVMVRVQSVQFNDLLQWLFIGSFVLVIFNMAPKIKDNAVTSSLYIFASAWLGVLFLVFSATVLYEMVIFVFGELPFLYSLLISGALLASAYAIWNAGNLHTRSYTINISKLEKAVSLVHLSDVHIGTVHRKKFLEEVVRKTNALQPDIVLMSGDLFDGSASIHEEMLSPLDNLVAPAYFSTGNHEEYEGLSLVRATIKNLKMRLLDSEMEICNGVQIIGINDRQSLPKDQSLKTILPTINYDKQKPVILMYHTPVEWEEAREHGVDLMLSGHTHNGQIFPFTILVRLAYKHIKGLYEVAGQYLHVTPGTGTWGPPMRLGSRNQVTLLKLVPQE